MPDSKGVIFREAQKFNQIWLWLLILLVTAGAWYTALAQIIYHKKMGTNSAPNWAIVILWVVFGLGFPLFFYSLKLITEVRYDGLYFCYFPLHFSFRKISWGELKKYEVRRYHPIRDYGGYGIRMGKRGKAYNVSGHMGVQLELVKGKNILIGSQKAEELVRAIDAALGKE